MNLKQMKEKTGFKIKPSILGAVAQFALLIYLLSSQFNFAIPDFIQGLLVGFSIVGNLAFLASIRKNKNL